MHVNNPRGAVQGLNFVWDIPLLAWIPEGQPVVVGATLTVAGPLDVTQSTSPWIVFNASHDIAIDYDGSNNPIYLGLAPTGSVTSGAVWMIKKLTFDGSNNLTRIQYANGSSSQNQIWDNRAALTYS